MFETEQICPYTGLRSFTEEESLYFKGREEDIDQATEQLQRNKFLMLTGASGDGKSSLIYAGIIPNARAGFLKSRYTQWCVADFRPERTPFYNLCRSIARQLEISNVFTVQTELNHGFSAIVDLYKNSKRYIDTSSTAWKNADDKEKAAIKREAANLIILVDQFEEFFTNPENYNKGVPSVDANLVLNLLLETSRISLEEDLPIYIVFTMRSDYIGQCAAFRGLPEYIGFSQFFVPRLNRTQLQNVIEEPAMLSGNRITRRLTERLIHDLTEGVDQLPILQHALNQIWHAADNGNEEMDLVHYAMVGGMPVDELPDEHVEMFKKWFNALSPEIKACYHKPDLQNVLDTHTNKLYEQAAEYYYQKTGNKIAVEDAKSIIKTAFMCLTKIDESRAVRNRMTLKEITYILGRPEFGTKEVGAVLNIFREPGNTFIRPFITTDSDTEQLNETAILDITHESLIRNWEYLEQWAKEEFDNYNISLDFEQQLNRWVESGKSNGFLLSIGPLTYFENWFNNLKPNAYWIARYLPEEIEQEKKLARATQVRNNAREFLNRSASKHVVTRTILRYGAKRIGAALALVAVLMMSSFAVRDYFRQQNDYVLRSVKAQTIELANRPRLSPEFPVPAITEQLILGNLKIPEVIDGIKDPEQKISIATGIATQLVIQGRYEPKAEILQSLTIADSLLESITPANTSEQLKLIHDFSVTSGIASFFNQDTALRSIVNRNAKRSATRVMKILKEQPADFTDIKYLNLALENGINHLMFSSDEIDELLTILSPFENNSRTSWTEKNYSRDKLMTRGSFNYGQRFNGLFQELAYLYAAAGRPEKALLCIDSILKYQDSYYENNYTTHIESATNIAAVFYACGNSSDIDPFVSSYCQRKNITRVEFYNRLVSQGLTNDDLIGATNFYSGAGGQIFLNLNIKLSPDSLLHFFFGKLKEEISKIGDPNERNFSLSVVLKNEAIFFASRSGLRGNPGTKMTQQLSDAINHYRQVPNDYLNQPIPLVGMSASDMITRPRKFLFLYPDYRVPFHPFEARSFVQFCVSPVFIDHVLDQDLFDTLYSDNEVFGYFELWLLSYQMKMGLPDFFVANPIPAEIIEQLLSKLEERKANQFADLNILYLHLGDYFFVHDEAKKGIGCYRNIQRDKLLNAFQYINFDFINTYSFELVGKAIANLTVNGEHELAYQLLNVFKKEVNRSSLYGYASQLVSVSNQDKEAAQRLVDSARSEMRRLDNPALFQPNRHQVAMALMYIDPKTNSNEAYRTIKNSFEKYQAMIRFSRAYARQGKLYQAQQQVPGIIAAPDHAGFLSGIAEGYALSQPAKKEWKKFKENELIFYRRYLLYVNENQ